MNEEINAIVETEEEETQNSEEIEEVGSGKGLAIAAGVGALVTLAAGVLYKRVIKPAVAKLKDRRRNKRMIDTEAEDSGVSQDEFENRSKNDE